MNYFEFLLLGHLAGDFLFQTSWMAREKITNLAALLLHSIVYTIFIGIAATLAGRLTWPALLTAFLGHVIIDNRVLTSFWIKTISKTDEKWLLIVIDQSWHVILLGLIVQLY
jgi:hypothetical protein